MPLFLHHYVLVFILFIEVVCLCIEYICSSCVLYIIVPFFLSRSPQEPLLYIIYTADDSLLLTLAGHSPDEQMLPRINWNSLFLNSSNHQVQKSSLSSWFKKFKRSGRVLPCLIRRFKVSQSVEICRGQRVQLQIL